MIKNELVKLYNTLYLNGFIKDNNGTNSTLIKNAIEIIDKLQKELDKKDICLKACEDNLIKERQLRIKQDKVINLIAESWKQDDIRSVEEIKEYFYKQVEEENE